jgi:hypothetical protein
METVKQNISEAFQFLVYFLFIGGAILLFLSMIAGMLLLELLEWIIKKLIRILIWLKKIIASIRSL